MSMWKIEIYNGTQNLEQWFQDAASKKYHNNSSKETLLDYLQNEEDTTLFLLYNNDRIVGNFVTHKLRSLGILGANAHRIAARMCVINDFIEGPRKISGMRSLNNTNYHDHINHQFLYAVGIKYLGLDTPMYVSSHPSSVGSQKIVHNKYCPKLKEFGLLHEPIELEYRNHFQFFWKLDTNKWWNTFLQQQWPESKDCLDIFFAQLEKV